MKKDEPVQAGFVYMLRCSDGTLYTGWTRDIEGRVRTHNAGKGAKYTRSRRPVEAVYLEAVGSRTEALRREAAIKKLSRKAKLALIVSERNIISISKEYSHDHSEDGIRNS